MPIARRSHVELFNFSFLDILACVIGLLIFILSIVAITASQSPALRNAAAGRAAGLRQAQRAAERAQRRLAAAQMSLSHSAAVLTKLGGRSGARRRILLLLVRRGKLALAAHRLKEKLWKLRHTPLKNAAQKAALAVTRADVLAIRRQTQATLAKLAAAAQSPVKEIRVYLPYVHPTARIGIFVELSGSRYWVLNNVNYHETLRHAGKYTVYHRRKSAAGARVGLLVPGRVPNSLNAFGPNATLLDCIVRPSAFNAFRAFRKWAWAAGFQLQWKFFHKDQTIVLVPMHRDHNAQ